MAVHPLFVSIEDATTRLDLLGDRTQLLGYYDSGAVKHLQLLSKLTRVPQAAYLREALDDLLRKYTVLRKIK